MNEQTVVHSHNGILSSNKKEQSQKHAKQKKPHKSTYAMISFTWNSRTDKKQCVVDRTQISCCLKKSWESGESGEGELLSGKRAQGILGTDENKHSVSWW